MGINLDFKFSSIPAIPDEPLNFAEAESPLGPLELLKGKWVGKGFNQIWRPQKEVADKPGQTRFLQLNFTRETLEFTEIEGPIMNRGFSENIKLFGLMYLQQITDAHVMGPTGTAAGLHVEPGIWIIVPATTQPSNPMTVARLATIPHGTSLVAQGTITSLSHAPEIPDASIVPFAVADPSIKLPEREQNLLNTTSFRTPKEDIPGITQTMVDNPNSILQSELAKHNVIATTVLHVSTAIEKAPSSGGGTSNIGFLEGVASDPNARVTKMKSTFWIETTKGPEGKIGYMLQYTQRVLLEFDGELWPHVSVATLFKH